MRVKFWGVRGSTPTPQAENLRYGGNTSCVEVRVGDKIYIFDCGTGLRLLGQATDPRIANGRCSRTSSFRIFIGTTFRAFPFCAPLYETSRIALSFHCFQQTRAI